jgi:hypothetical protein
MTENLYNKLLRFLILFIQCLNIEKAKDDFRKIGITIGGAGLLGGMLGQYSRFETVFLIALGITAWLIELYEQEV